MSWSEQLVFILHLLSLSLSLLLNTDSLLLAALQALATVPGEAALWELESPNRELCSGDAETNLTVLSELERNNTHSLLALLSPLAGGLAGQTLLAVS